jgi:hypothetical protein
VCATRERAIFRELRAKTFLAALLKKRDSKFAS